MHSLSTVTEVGNGTGNALCAVPASGRAEERAGRMWSAGVEGGCGESARARASGKGKWVVQKMQGAEWAAGSLVGGWVDGREERRSGGSGRTKTTDWEYSVMIKAARRAGESSGRRGRRAVFLGAHTQF